MSPEPSNSVLIVDGTAVAYRAFYAVRGLSTRDGQPTNALFGFIRMLRQLEARWKPGRIVVAFDGGSPAHRLEKCPDYKAQRAPMPDDLRSQLPLLNEFLDAAGIPRIRLDDQEADDVMATLATRAASEGRTVRLATSDKDLMQLVNESIRIIPPSKTDEEMGPAAVQAKTGVPPSRIVDWLALIGDVSDNIPGVRGVGPKTATQLISRFGSLEECLARVGEIESDSLRRKLLDGQATARLNVELMQLDRDVPGVPGWGSIPAPSPDSAKLNAFFTRWELHRFVEEMKHPPPASTTPKKPTPPADGQLHLF